MEGERAEHLLADSPRASSPACRGARGETAVLVDALVDPDVCRELLEVVRRRRALKGQIGGRLIGRPTPALRRALGTQESPEPSIFRAEQSNTSVLFGQPLILKLFRRVEAGVNPDLEIGRFLSDRTDFANTPTVAGSLEYAANGAEPATLAILHEFVPNEGDAWQYTLDALSRFYERVVTGADPERRAPARAAAAGPARAGAAPGSRRGRRARGLVPAVGPAAGRRTAELHAALAAETMDPGLAPEPFTPLYQRSVYQSMRNLVGAGPPAAAQLAAEPGPARARGRRGHPGLRGGAARPLRRHHRAAP